MLGSLQSPKAAVLSVVLSVLFVGLLWLVQPYAPPVPVNPHGLGSLDWWAWWIFNK